MHTGSLRSGLSDSVTHLGIPVLLIKSADRDVSSYRSCDRTAAKAKLKDTIIWRGLRIMSTINSLNTQYVEAIKVADMLRQYEGKIQAEMDNSRQTDTAKAVSSITIFQNMAKEIKGPEFELLKDIAVIGGQYVNCLNAIGAFRKILTGYVGGNSVHVSRGKDEIVREQRKYDDLKDAFFRKYNYSVNSVKALNQIMLSSVSKEKLEAEERVSRIKEQAIQITSAEYTTELKHTDPIANGNMLPGQMLVAREPMQSLYLKLLRDIGISKTYQNIHSDLRKQGNVMVISDFEHMEDRRIDEFIIAYVLRFIETFPLGNVNVHIFDQNINYLYKRLSNCFQTEKSGETAKRIIQIHNTHSDLAAFRDVTCEDIFKKTSVDKPDLYAVYEEDRSDPFNLIILRDGLVDGSGYASAETLDMINSLTKPGEMGHRCGLRFLIVDNSASFEKNLIATNKHFLDLIRQNCGMRIQFGEDTGFSINGKSVEVLHIPGNMDAYVQERSTFLANAINSKEKSYISLEDVSANELVDQLGNILYIPVGKSGGNVVELPLSCRDEDGTVEGQCIGYIAIGQSGSGKSSFFHSIVLNGCMKYSPKDLQFWLLDFKNGGASSKYSDSGIPHIKIIAENNKIDDALCLFQMVLEEMERRSKAFNRCFTDNIIEYNKKAVAEGLEYFPRIVIAIDEVQEIFREDNASVLQKLISSISTRMRSAGMHFVMVAQNLSEGKSYMLKDAFMPSATGRICFRVSQDIPRDSGFEDDFVQRKQEISDLKTGEAYVSYGKDTIKKVKMAFISPQDMNDKVFANIRNKFSEYSYLKPKVIGSKGRLAITSARQGMHGTYLDVFKDIGEQNGIIDAVLGEDVYRMSPFHIQFSQDDNSSVLFLGSDKRMASSLCTSVALSLFKQDVQVHLFNGDRTRLSYGLDSTMHPFMFLCQEIRTSGSNIQIHRLNQLKDVLKDVYSEYLSRQAIVQRADDEDLTFAPIILIVNDLFGIECFNKNDIIESSSESNVPVSKQGSFNFDYDIFSDRKPDSQQTERQFREGVQNIVGTILKNGYRYNLHMVLAIKGDPSIWHTGRSLASVNNIMLFNNTEYTDQIQNSYYLKEMLKNISNDGEPETVAVWAGRKTFSKVRPVIYDMSDQKEREALQSLVSG